MEHQYKYYAFVSYSRKDEKYAKWIQDKLEAYKLPSKVVHDNPDLKKGIRPVFRDKTDLGAGVLYENLGKELAASRYLIVVSSPTSAHSDWVEKETREFLKTHAPEYIIPMIVDGTPNSNDENECLNPAIKEITPELLGVNIHEIGKQQALTKVVAKLLNLSYDTLWQRHKRQEKRRNIMLGIGAFILLCASLLLVDYNRPKYEYYASIAEYGDGWLPKGIVPLSKDQVRHRFHSYRFTYRRNKLREVALVNSHDRKVDDYSVFVHPDRHATKPIIQHYDLSNDIILTEEFSGENYNRIDFMNPPDKGGGSSALRARSSGMTEIRRYALTRNENGFVVRVDFKRYPGVDEVNTLDENGNYGYEYEVDSIGQILAKYFIDENLQRVPLRKGLASIRYTYDALGGIVREQYLKIDGQPHFTTFGGAETRRTFDAYGNNIAESYYDGAGQPCIAPYYGYATFKTIYDERGNKTEQSYYDVKDSLCMSANHCALLTQQFNDRGDCIEIAYFGKDRKPCVDIQGFARVEQKHDAYGRIIGMYYYGVDGKPCVSELGYASVIKKYDERGNVIEDSYYGVDGKPCLRELGCAKIQWKYDERNYLIEETYYDVDGQPCLRNIGVAKLKQKHDERGNVIEYAYFGIDGKPCMCGWGYAIQRNEYDERGNVVEEAYFDTEGKPCISIWETAKMRNKYDEFGNLIESESYGINSEPCLNDLGYAKVASVYNDRGKIIESKYYDVHGKPCLTNYGIHRIAEKYDGRGVYLGETYFDTNGNLVLCADGFASIERVVDVRGNVVSETYFNALGARCNAKYFYTKFPDVVDNVGCFVKAQSVTEDGQVHQLPQGYSKVEGKYDANNQLTEVIYYDKSDNVLITVKNPVIVDD